MLGCDGSDTAKRRGVAASSRMVDEDGANVMPALLKERV
jgi:hypothetical protein